MCKICSDAYHALCHTPKLKPNVTASSDWICSNCKDTSGDCDYISEGIIKIKKNLEHLQKMKDNIIKNEDNLNLQIKQEDIKSDPDE